MNDTCPNCGEKLHPSNFPDLKKMDGKTLKFENKLVCKNFPACEDAEPD